MPNRPTVFLTGPLPPECMQRLADSTNFQVNSLGRDLTKSELIEAVRQVDALICFLTDKVDADVLSANPNLKVVANYAVGFNNIDVATATERKIAVTNTPDVLTDTTADMACALIFSVARRVVEGDRLVRSRRWNGWAPLQLLGTDIMGATIGIIGTGRIGRAVAERAKAFRMNVVYWNRTRLDPETESKLGIRYCELGELLGESDFVSLHLAYSNETHHLINAARLSQMKPSAYLINTARGAVVDEKALVKALTQKTIAGAGLDVFEHEPALEPELYEMDNVVITPHLGSATTATRTMMGDMVIENCLVACAGNRPPNLVNTSVF
ncbi:putative 2-hydroxyacid dehydrogenase [Planctomycetes bacterium CA13]|uniref:Putative 2-hydroxyacid dehydrogenase n=1 Tax=Novipirellula herctigrandis TaxID=2527986 RepID=A0A5C5Z4E2_9BACT|nr:putative 2-hydroxyacid dehydrogenase [Planctomycetes bacterium CA13]